MRILDSGVDHKTRNAFDKNYLVLTESLREELNIISDVANTKQDTNVQDEGTCVFGGGIYIRVIEPRKKYPSRVCIVRAPFQGNIANYKALKPVLEYVNTVYPMLNARYDDGNMD